MTRGIFPLVASNVNVNSPPSRIIDGGVGDGVGDGVVEAEQTCQLVFQVRQGMLSVLGMNRALRHSKCEMEGRWGRTDPLTRVLSEEGCGGHEQSPLSLEMRDRG